ncbi:MAG TPA: hypothetical protein VGL35_06405 [Rhizomicrobium sp.]|jgi:hypothetical protein
MTWSARFIEGGVALLAGAVVSWAANAHVVISSDPTQNMSCSAGTCEPTAKDAVLNVSDLQNMLVSGNVTVTTTGSGVQAQNIDVEAPLTWSAPSTLALEADSRIAVDREISVPADGGLSLTKSTEVDAFPFGTKGRIVFQNLSSPFTINGTAVTLVNNIASLAGAIAANPSGSYALAGNYDASQDGTYTASPIQTTFTGNFDGLGNTISHLSIDHTGSRTGVGLFVTVLEPGVVEHVRSPMST